MWKRVAFFWAVAVVVCASEVCNVSPPPTSTASLLQHAAAETSKIGSERMDMMQVLQRLEALEKESSELKQWKEKMEKDNEDEEEEEEVNVETMEEMMEGKGS